MPRNTTRYVRIYADTDGESHFDDVEAVLAPTNYAPPPLPLEVSAAVDAQRLVFVRAASGGKVIGTHLPSDNSFSC